VVRLRLREIAEKQGLNMLQLSHRSATSLTSIRRYWYGTKSGRKEGDPLRNVDLDLLERFAKVLGVKVLELFEEVEGQKEADKDESAIGVSG
jgi:transcriptional regulator with XRE-family HTH domain